MGEDRNSAARFERALVVDAVLPSIATASYEVDVYDDQGTLLATQAGQTTDGTVTAAWNTVDPQGNPTVNGNLAVYLYIIPPSGPPIYIGPKWYIQERAALDGRYIITWGWDTGGSTSHATRKSDMMLDGMINIVGNPALDNEYLLSPAANVPFGSTFRVQTEADKTTLENEFKSSANKNFFWFGHGSDIHISPFAGENAPVTILADDIENWLENKAHRAMGKEHLSSIYQNKNPYRLAIISGCETYSAAFANAFGVDFETSSTFVYNLLGRTPRAFVGWTTQIKAPGVFLGIDAGLHVKYAEALATMNSYWMSGADLQTSLIEFADKAQANGFGTEVWDFEIAGCEDLVRLP